MIFVQIDIALLYGDLGERIALLKEIVTLSLCRGMNNEP